MSSEVTAREVNRRRTFAIISHPDAGKTTLTEKLLLFGGAIQMAGTVKGRKATRHATSDWMRLEQERGISITSSVMQFPYVGRADQLARHAGPRGLLRGHVSDADRGRQCADGHRRGEGRRDAHDQAHGGVPATHDADHQLREQARPRRARARRAARRHRERARHRVCADDVADWDGPGVPRHLPSRRGLRVPLSESRRQPAARRAPRAGHRRGGARRRDRRGRSAPRCARSSSSCAARRSRSTSRSIARASKRPCSSERRFTTTVSASCSTRS